MPFLERTRTMYEEGLMPNLGELVHPLMCMYMYYYSLCIPAGL